MMDYNQLAALTAVVEEGGFEHAGETLHITQSAVTQRIRQLEENSGRILLMRTQPPRPTAEGRRLIEHFRKIRLLENEVAKDLKQEETSAPLIPLAVNADSLATWFSPVLSAYMRRNGGRVEIRVADQELTHSLLSRGEVMGCVSASPSPVRACRSEALGSMTYRLAGSRSYRKRYFPRGVDAESLGKAPRMDFNRDDGLLEAWFRTVFPERILPQDTHYVPSSEQFPVLIGTGRVCGMITEDQFRRHREAYDLVDLSMDKPVRVPLFWQRWSIESEELEALSRLIREEAARHLEPIGT